MVLEPAEAKRYYDRFGKWQDTQGFYENPALRDLVAHADFGRAERVFEFGCGTGRFAAELLAEHLPPSATYVGCDLSSTMVDLAAARLAPYGNRARVILTDGTMKVPLPDGSVDRVVSTYVLDLLCERDIGEFLGEAHRVLDTGGRLCLVSLTTGTTPLSRFVTRAWTSIFRLRPRLVGGCRPIRLEDHTGAARWETEYLAVRVSFGVPSEVMVARPALPSGGGGNG